MELTHTFSVPSDIEGTWELLNDLEQVADCFPGAAITSVDGDEFAGTVKVKLGPVSMEYKGTGVFTDRDEQQRRAVIDAKGKDKRGNGTANATVTAHLTPAGDGAGDGTSIEVHTDLAITGKPAQFGRGVIEDVSDRLLDEFVACLSDRLGAPQEEPSGATDSSSQETSPADAATGQAAAVDPAAQSAPASGSAEIDLGSTVVPVLLRRYAPHIAGAVIVLVVLSWIRKRRKRRKRR